MEVSLPHITVRLVSLAALFAMSSLPPALSDELPVNGVFPVGVRRGEVAVVQVDSTRWPLNVECTESSIRWKALKKKGRFEVDVSPDTVPGLIWFRLYDAKGVSKWRSLIVESAERVAESEPNNRLAKATAVKPPCIVDGRLGKRGDVDVFRVNVRKGQRLTARVTAHYLLDSPVDAIVQLCDAFGHVLVQAHDDRELDPAIEYVPRTDATLYLRLFAFSSTPSSAIAFTGSRECGYQIEVSTESMVDAWSPMAVAARGGTLKLSALGRHGLPLGTASFDSSNVFTRADSRSSATALTGVSQAKGSGISGSGRAPWRWIGSPHAMGLAPLYGIADGTHVAACSDDPPTDAIPLSVPSVACGSFSRADSAFDFQFPAKAGEQFVINVWSRRLGYRADPWLEIRNAQGKQLAQFDDRSRTETDVAALWKAPQDGKYHVVIRDRFHGYGSRWRFLMELRRQLPAVRLTVQSFHWELSTAKPTRIEVAIERVAGWKGDFTLGVEGLADGVQCEPITVSGAEPKGKATLELTASSEGQLDGMPIRIVARASDGTVISRARWKEAASFSPADRFWITR